jgi:hypothetical protein
MYMCIYISKIEIQDISPPPEHFDTKASAVNETASEISIDLKSSPAIDTTGEFLQTLN